MQSRSEESFCLCNLFSITKFNNYAINIFLIYYVYMKSDRSIRQLFRKLLGLHSGLGFRPESLALYNLILTLLMFV